MRSLVSPVVLVVLAAACRPFAPAAAPSRLRPALVDDERPARKWPASQPDLAEDVDTMVELGNELCDCAAERDVRCARGVVTRLQLWLDDTHADALDLDQLSPEQDGRASAAADRIQECGDEVLGSGSWCPGPGGDAGGELRPDS